MSSSEDSDDDGSGFTRCIPPLPARAAINKHTAAPSRGNDRTATHDAAERARWVAKERGTVFDFLVDESDTVKGSTLEIPKYIETDITRIVGMSKSVARVLYHHDESLMYTNYSHRLSLLTPNNAINKKHIVHSAALAPSYPLDFFFGPDTDANRLLLIQAKTDLEAHGTLVWGCPSYVTPTEWGFYPSGEFTASFLCCMERDWDAPLSNDPLFRSLKLYEGYKLEMRYDGSWHWCRPRGPIQESRRRAMDQLTGALRRVVSPRHKASALAFALRHLTNEVCDLLLEYDANPRLCWRQLLERLRESTNKEIMCRRIIKLPRLANTIAPWTTSERRELMNAIATGNSPGLLKSAPALLFSPDEAELAFTECSNIVHSIILTPKAMSFKGRSTTAARALLWSVKFVPSPEQVTHKGVEYECLVTAVASDADLCGQLTWMCKHKGVHDRAILLRDARSTDPSIKAVLKALNIESITANLDEMPFRVEKDGVSGPGFAGLAVHHERGPVAASFIPKCDRLGIKKHERKEVESFWPVVVAEMQHFVSLDDVDCRLRFMDLFRPNVVSCEPDLSGTLVSNPHGWRLHTPCNLGDVATAGTRVVFELKVKCGATDVNAAFSELSRAAWHIRRKAMADDTPDENIQVVLVAVFPAPLDATQCLFLKDSGINVHLNGNMKKKKPVLKRRREGVDTGSEVGTATGSEA